jgi:uncharacterized protein YjbJ (UPF0337 family)
MGATADQAKGRAKEAVADLTGDKDLKSEGTADRRVGEVKEKLDQVKGKLDEAVDKGRHALDRK